MAALFLAQIVAVSTLTVFVTVGSLIFIKMGAAPHFAATPVLAIVASAAFFARAYGLLVRRVGDGLALITYLALSASGLIVACWSIRELNLLAFILGCVMYAAQVANAQSYRFIAILQVPDKKQPSAMALIVVGALFGGILGPACVILASAVSKDSSGGEVLILCTLLTVMVAIAIFFASFRERNEATQTTRSDSKSGRPTSSVIGAHLCGAVAAISMNLIMVSGPVALSSLSRSQQQIALAMMLHMTAMYAPSLIIPLLIRRTSFFFVLLAGAVLGAFAGVLFGYAKWDVGLLLAMVFVGISWNFLYVTSGLMVSRETSGNVADQAKFNFNYLIATAISTAASTPLLQFMGGISVAGAALTLNVLAIVVILITEAKFKTETVS